MRQTTGKDWEGFIKKTGKTRNLKNLDKAKPRCGVCLRLKRNLAGNEGLKEKHNKEPLLDVQHVTRQWTFIENWGGDSHYVFQSKRT